MHRLVTLTLGAVLVAGAAGCGAGQEAATAQQVTSSPGAVGEIGSIQVRDLQFVWSEPVSGDEVYAPGADVPLQATIINGENAGVGGADRLVAVSSPVAASGRIIGDATLSDGQQLVAGYDGPVSSITPEGAREVEILLEGLIAPIRSGLTYPVVLTFANAGELRLQVGVETPAVLPPRVDEPKDDPPVVGTGPDPAVVPDGE